MFLKISKLLKKISFILKQKALYFELKHFIRKGDTYIKTVYVQERGIGKTYSLVKLAKKYNCPIITPNMSMMKHIYKIDKNIKVIDGYNGNNIIGHLFDLVLIDEGIQESILTEIIMPRSKQVVGFKCSY